jgi:CMP-N-acetylneuraminic acid synthetase
MKTIAFIPARAGSKGLPGKNIKLLNGQPMLYYTLGPALLSDANRVVLSSDSVEIKSIADEFVKRLNDDIQKKYVFHQRSVEIAGDKATLYEAILNYFETFPDVKKEFNWLLLLQPTSPVRNPEDINNALKQIVSSGKKTLFSVSEPMQHPGDMITLNERGETDFLLNRKENSQRQDYQEIFFVNGAIYIADLKFYMEKKTFFDSESSLYKMNSLYSIDVDTQEDFILAEALLARMERDVSRLS